MQMTETTNEHAPDKKRHKVKYLKGDAVVAARDALSELRDMPVVKSVYKPTARSIITDQIKDIIELEKMGHDPRTIFNHIKKKTGMRIDYTTYKSYVSRAASVAGLDRIKPGRRPAPAPTPDPVPAPTPISETGWACESCASQARRTEKNGRAWWQCFSGRTLYADDQGSLTQLRLQPKF